MGKPKQEHVYFFWSTAIIICMLLAFFALLFASCNKAKETPAEEPDPALDSIQPYDPSATPEVGAIGVIPTADPSAPTATVLGETADMGQDYIDSMVFLGDSTTYGLGFYDVVSDTQVWTPASGTLTLSLWSIATIVYEAGTENEAELTIAEAVAQKQPAYMVLTLGVNGVSFLDQATFIDEYTKLVNTIKEASPNTKIILNSIYPVTTTYDASGSGITNAKIDSANLWVESVATSTGVKYLDTQSILKDENGALRTDYSNDNALHLTGDALGLVINYIRTHGYV